MSKPEDSAESSIKDSGNERASEMKDFVPSGDEANRFYHNPSLPDRSQADINDDEKLEKVYSTDQSVFYKEDEDKPDLSWESIKRYCITRFTTLGKMHAVSLNTLNPFPELRKMTWQNWNYFIMGYGAWLCASYDFFTVSVAVSPLASKYGKATSDISWGLSLVLFVRSAGAIIFGIWTDRYSRKWPYITTLSLFLICQLCTPFAQTYEAFLGVRWLSGIAMGGVYACSAATAIEDAPVKARSLLSGLFFSSYGMGFIFAIIFYRAFLNVNGDQYWKVQFWFSVWLPAILIGWRLLWPETKYFTKVLQARQLILADAIAANGGEPLPKKNFREKLVGIKETVSKYWLLFAYLVLLLVGPNYLTHASQDLFPTVMRKQLDFSEDAVTVAITVINLGAICGGIFFGQIMEITGRRNALLIALVMAGCFVYPTYMLKTKSAVLGAGFMLYFAVLGVWGVIPIHLSELSPPDARALVSGLAYQLGNLASAASVVIESDVSKNFPIKWDSEGNPTLYDSSKTMAILTGATVIYTFVLVFVGHEKFHRDLSSPILKKYITKVEEMEDSNLSEEHAMVNGSLNSKESHELVENS